MTIPRIKDDVFPGVSPNIIEVGGLSAIGNFARSVAIQPRITCYDAIGRPLRDTGDPRNISDCKTLHHPSHRIRKCILRRPLRARQLPVILCSHRINVVDDIRNAEANMCKSAEYESRIWGNRDEYKIDLSLPHETRKRVPLVPQTAKSEIAEPQASCQLSG